MLHDSYMTDQPFHIKRPTLLRPISDSNEGNTEWPADQESPARASWLSSNEQFTDMSYYRERRTSDFSLNVSYELGLVGVWRL